MSLELSGCYLVGAVDWMSLQLFGSYMVRAIGWICRWSYLVVIWLVQLDMSLELSGSCLVGAADWVYRCSYLVLLVLIWLVQLLGCIVGVIWFLSGWCS